ncbi:MAG: hypothetical protein K2N58_07305, partial [Treponemataceae bacterium]|nr:hypothetical protein [Treponemataceae bacterium]
MRISTFFTRKFHAKFGRVENIFARAEIPPEDDFPEELRGAVFCADEIEADDEILRTAKKVFGIQHLMPWQ